MNKPKVEAKDIEPLCPVRKVVLEHMSVEDTVKQFVQGAKQKKRDKYKLDCLVMISAWQGIKPNDKLDVDLKKPVEINIIEQPGTKELPRVGKKRYEPAK